MRLITTDNTHLMTSEINAFNGLPHQSWAQTSLNFESRHKQPVQRSPPQGSFQTKGGSWAPGRENTTIRCNLANGKVTSAEWIMDTVKTLVKRELAMQTVRGISPQQFILMALSVIAPDTHRGHPRRDHAPTSRSNHQHLRPRLQHSGGHGGWRLLPWQHNKSLDWQDWRLQFRLNNVSRTRRKLLWMQSVECLWMMWITGVHKGIYSTLHLCSAADIRQKRNSINKGSTLLGFISRD